MTRSSPLCVATCDDVIFADMFEELSLALRSQFVLAYSSQGVWSTAASDPGQARKQFEEHRYFIVCLYFIFVSFLYSH